MTNLKKQLKKIIAVSAAILLFPATVFATDWGAALGVNSNGTVGISVGVGNMSGWTQMVSGNPYGLPQGSILGIVSNLLFWLLAIFAILGVIGFVIAGIIYLVSAGDDDMIARAKKGMTYSIVGIIVGLSGFLIMQAVSMLLSGASSSF